MLERAGRGIDVAVGGDSSSPGTISNLGAGQCSSQPITLNIGGASKGNFDIIINLQSQEDVARVDSVIVRLRLK